MAKIALNILVSDVRNRLGNIVFSKWKKTNYVREYITYSRGSTAKQAEVRSAFKILSSVWKITGLPMQNSWNHFASGNNMTGRNAFIGDNMKKMLAIQPLDLFKPLGENTVVSLNAVTGTAGAISCTFSMPQGSTDKYLFFFAQKKDAAGKGTENIKRFDTGLNPVSPFSITGLDAGAEYFVYAVIADAAYENATKVSESVSGSAKAGA